MNTYIHFPSSVVRVQSTGIKKLGDYVLEFLQLLN